MASVKVKNPVVLIIIAVAIIFCAKIFWWDKRPQVAKAATTIGHVTIPDAPQASLSNNATLLPLPGTGDAGNGGTKITIDVMEWNSQFGLMYANGGTNTTKGSLIDKANLQISIFRQDDCGKACADLSKFANDYKNAPSTPGVFAIFMGDGMPGFASALVPELAKLGSDYAPIVIYACGKSYGEDKLMGPRDWKVNPQNAIGKAICCVLRDGDMNILLKWAGDNGLKVNPDETSYDPNAINLVSPSDYLDAANKYINNYTEKRKLIVNGKKTQQDTTIGVDGVATWTPGDVNIAKGKGGLVTIASTKQYATQMPAVLLTIKKFAYDHRTDMENLIIALATAGDQVRSFTQAQAFAAKVSAQAYNDKDQNYWLKYYKGSSEKDITGLSIDLGGSMAFNLADAANMFGLGKDGVDRYKAVYTTFGDILSKMYPELIPPKYPSYTQVVDKSFIQTVISNHPELLEGKAVQVQYADEITSQVSSKSYQIQFATGSSTIMASSYGILNDIKNSAVVAEGLKLGVYGHTDNVGNPDQNQVLSEARANSVKEYLTSKGLAPERIEAKGFGDTQPIEDNGTAAGKAKNRRVQIVLGE